MALERLRRQRQRWAAVYMIPAVLMLALNSAMPAAADILHTSVPLSDVLARARSSPQVELMVRLQLKRENVRREDVICRAALLDRNWRRLSGTPVGPYDCAIGKTRLVLDSRPVYKDAAGARVRRSDPELKARAVNVSEHFFRWRWQRA